MNDVFSTKDLVWTGYDLKEFPVLFVSSQNKSAYLYQNGQAQQHSFDLLPKHLHTFPIPFAVESIEGRNTLVMLIDNLLSKPNESASSHFIVHESFHIFYQSNASHWSQKEGHQKKGLILPIDPKPRYYRWEMANSISSYLETGDVNKLKNFSSWYRKWEKQFSLEATSDADRTEGSAEYVAVAAGSYIESGAINPEDRHTYLKKVRKEWFEKNNLSFDDEAYLLGALAGLALDKLSTDGWKARVNSGESPLAILAKIHQPSFKKDDAQLLIEFKSLASKKMDSIDSDGTLVLFLNALSNKKMSFVAVDNSKLSPFTFSMQNAFRIKDPSSKNGYINVSDISSPIHLLSTDKENKIMDINKPQLLLSFEKTPCDTSASSHWNVWGVDSSLVKNGSLQSKDFHLYAKSRTVNTKNALWICVD
ncbi:MAG: hypothetical protein IT287_03455 [Bdellovibrionaceae bacterium]|nr:hypothetical protein [Pseudobdellovibrionaceae bacterium]